MSYTPTSIKNSTCGYQEEHFDGYFISETMGKVQGFVYHYEGWFRELVTPKSAKCLIDSVAKHHTNVNELGGDGSNYLHKNLKKFREFLVRYADGEFMVAKEQWSNRGMKPKPKYFNELEKHYQNNITKMIDTITSVIG